MDDPADSHISEPESPGRAKPGPDPRKVRH